MFIKNLIEVILQDVIGFSTLFVGIVGGGFGLHQWRKSNVYKRGGIVRKLIEKVRDDEDIAIIMEIIDWNKGLEYDGEFHINEWQSERCGFIDKSELFRKIDKTLSHLSYICYLKHHHTLTNKDMIIFDYEIRRLVDNESIINYLYSLFHWSSSLNVAISFEYLIDYCIQKGYIYYDFKDISSTHYKQFLKLPTNYCLTKIK